MVHHWSVSSILFSALRWLTSNIYLAIEKIQRKKKKKEKIQPITR